MQGSWNLAVSWLLLLTIVWSTVAQARPTVEGPSRLHAAVTRNDIKTVHVIFSNHLDVGFGGLWPESLGFDDAVINKYFDVYFPLAVSLGVEFEAAFPPQRFVWTTHAWLISLYLDCPPGMGLHCPRKEAVHNFTKAVHRGDITWHAYPFNGQLEFADPPMVEFALDLVHDLDERFDRPLKTTMSQRDIPGTTRTALPILAKKGVRALSVGVNGGSAPPGVPKNTPFIWRDPVSGAQVLATWHPGDYGGIMAGDCVQVQNFSHALCPAWRIDNAGPPPDIKDINMTLNFVRTQFPGAEVRASTFEDYLTHLEEVAPMLNLPVVTDEIGDTWVFGVQSDPVRVAEYRAAQRLRTWCLKEGSCSLQDPAFWNFSRILLKVHEHTWGLDVFQALGDFVNYSNSGLQEALREQHQGHMDCIRAWNRQFQYTKWAVEALPHDHPISQQWHQEVAGMKAAKHSYKGYLEHAVKHPLDNGLLRFETDVWLVEVDPVKGSFSRLQRFWPKETKLGVNWAGGEDSSFGQLLYSAYNEASYDVVWEDYEWNPQVGWFELSFGKVNCSLGNPKRAEINPRLTKALSSKDPASGSLVVLLHYEFPDWAVRDAGAPAAMWTIVHLHGSGKRLPGPRPHLHPHPHPHTQPGDLHVDVLWVNKTATRLPEALWLQFRPGSGTVDSDSWTMNKLGDPVKPSEVMLNGSMSQHAVQEEAVTVQSADKSEELLIGSLDASIVSPGSPTVFPNVKNVPDMTKGMSFNLMNNVWGTNWIMWVPYTEREVNMAFRFFLRSKLLKRAAAPS